MLLEQQDEYLSYGMLFVYLLYFNYQKRETINFHNIITEGAG